MPLAPQIAPFDYRLIPGTIRRIPESRVRNFFYLFTKKAMFVYIVANECLRKHMKYSFYLTDEELFWQDNSIEVLFGKGSFNYVSSFG